MPMRLFIMVCKYDISSNEKIVYVSGRFFWILYLPWYPLEGDMIKPFESQAFPLESWLIPKNIWKVEKKGSDSIKEIILHGFSSIKFCHLCHT